MTRAEIPEPVTAVTDLAGAWLPARLATVEQRLAEIVGGHGSTLADDAGSTLAAGGKRMRPLLVLLCAGPSAGPDALRAATAIELGPRNRMTAVAEPSRRGKGSAKVVDAR